MPVATVLAGGLGTVADKTAQLSCNFEHDFHSTWEYLQSWSDDVHGNAAIGHTLFLQP